MAKETPQDNNVKSTIEAVTGLMKAVPIYDDALQPAAKQVGKSLETLTKVVNIALLPLRGLIWGYESISDWLNVRLAEKLSNVPYDDILTPSPQIAGPTIEALRFAAHDETLRELYANLLATAMNREDLHLAHPGYVEILKNLCADEALLLRSFIEEDQFAAIDLNGSDIVNRDFNTFYSNFTVLHRLPNIARPDLIPSFINNLCRLGIIDQPYGVILGDSDVYESLMNDSFLDNYKEDILDLGLQIDYIRKGIFITPFGRMFVDHVVDDYH